MTNEEMNTFEELFAELHQDSEFRKEYWRQKPYYDLVLEIKKRRKELNLTQEQLAERSGTRQSNISRIESAEQDIRLSTLVQIAEALEAKVEIRLTPGFEIDDNEYTELCKITTTNMPSQEQTAKLTVKNVLIKI